MTDAKSEDQTVQWRVFRPMDRFQKVGGRFLGHSFQPQKLLACQKEEVCRVTDQALRDQLGDQFLSQPFDIEGSAGREVSDMLADLRRTGQPDATVCDFPLHSDDMGSAFRTGGRHGKRFFNPDPVGRDDLDHFGNHIACPADHHLVSDADIFFPDLLLVVEGCSADHDAADADGLHDGNGRQDARASDLNDDVLDHRPLQDSRKLARYRPAWTARDGSKALLQVQVVYLDHNSVNFVREFIAYPIHVTIVTDAFLDVLSLTDQRIDLKSPGGQLSENLFLGSEGGAFHRSNGVAEKGQRSPCRDS